MESGEDGAGGLPVRRGPLPDGRGTDWGGGVSSGHSKFGRDADVKSGCATDVSPVDSLGFREGMQNGEVPDRRPVGSLEFRVGMQNGGGPGNWRIDGVEGEEDGVHANLWAIPVLGLGELYIRCWV